jgi:hypothetical protein
MLRNQLQQKVQQSGCRAVQDGATLLVCEKGKKGVWSGDGSSWFIMVHDARLVRVCYS